MKKTLKKGFTIVELVIVIAVVAILAAVLIPTFVSVVNKANVSNDTALVRNLNSALISEESTGNKPATMTDVIKIAEEYGYNVENLQTKASGYKLLWNQETNRFYVQKDGKEITTNPEVTNTPDDGYTYWEISDTVSEIHSVYLKSYSGTEVNTSKGIDLGNCESITAVNYANNGTKQNVTICTNGGTLTVNAANDTVNHYGLVNTLSVDAVAPTDCYHEYGTVIVVEKFVSGKFTAEEGCKFHQSEAEVKELFNDVTYDFEKALYEQHYYDKNGVCVAEDCHEIDASHTHSWGAWEVLDDTNHKRTCTICQNIETAAHDISDSNATCTECNYQSKFVAYIGATGYETLEAAFAAAKEAKGGSIKLIKNYELKNYIDVYGKSASEKYTYELDLNGKTITAQGLYAFRVWQSTFIINDSSEGMNGKITGTVTKSSNIILGQVGGNITINGGNIIAVNSGCAVMCKSVFIMTGGTIIGADTEVAGRSALDLDGSWTSATITGGTISGIRFCGETEGNIVIGEENGENSKISIIEKILYYSSNVKVNLTIKSGTFSSAATFEDVDKNNNASGISITGGLFGYKPDTKYIESGYEATNVNGKWVVSKQSV